MGLRCRGLERPWCPSLDSPVNVQMDGCVRVCMGMCESVYVNVRMYVCVRVCM